MSHIQTDRPGSLRLLGRVKWGASVSDRVLAGPTLALLPLISPRAGVLHGSPGWFEGYSQVPGTISSVFGGLKVDRKDKGVAYQ